MGIFNKKPKNDFKEPAEISGGDLYNQYIQLQNQMQIDLNNRQNLNENKEAKNLIKEKLDYKKLIPYYLLEIQTNYFINTLNFETKNNYLFKQIKLLLRAAFKNGVAAIYKVKNKYIIGTVSIEKCNIYNELSEITLTPLNEMNICFTDETIKKYNKLKLSGEELKNVVLLKWGSAGISAWLTIYKMCLIQYDLLTMINVDSFSYIKKLVYKINDPNVTYKELNEYFDVDTPFIKIPKGVDLKNRLEINESFGIQTPNLLTEYYKQVMGIYYSLYGRRTNNDYKKERSVTQEIGLTNDNYIILEKDWIDEFKIFIKEIKEKFNEDIEYLENTYTEEGSKEDNTINVNDEVK